MSTFSKVLQEFSKRQTCGDFIHPNETCAHQFFDMAWKGLFSMGQYYLPTLLIPLVLKMNSLNWGKVRNALVDYGKSILITDWFMVMIFAGICRFYKIFGSLYFPYVIRLPIAFGSLPFIFYPERIKQWQSIGLFNLSIETIIRKSDNRIIEYLRKSRVFGTLVFMSFSAVILAGRRITGIQRFWFTSIPAPIRDKGEPASFIKPCVHHETCFNYISEEFTKSSELALALGLLKFIVSNYKRIKLTEPVTLTKLLLRNLDYGLMAFTISYNTLFKLLSCWFNNTTGENSVRNTMAAGFISGISYGFYPIYMLFTYGLTASLQMVWFIYSKYIASRVKEFKCGDRCGSSNDLIKLSYRFINFVNKLPVAVLVMSGCFMHIIQERLLHPYATPIYAHNFMSLATNKRIDSLVLRCSDVILGFSGAG